MTDDANLALELDEKNNQSLGDFKFEPIKGYPMLKWGGKRPFTSTRYYPAQLKEQHGQPTNDWLNKIFWGDNLQVMSHLLREYRGQVDLIYIDPPYDSKADYKKKIKLKTKDITNDLTSFEDKQYTDIWTNDEYLQFMYERLILLRELLSNTGSIYVHIDYRKSHHIRSIMDEIFGNGGSDLKSAGFKNEIAYGYRIQGVGKASWARKHDTILFYSKTDKHKFRPLKERIYYKKPFIDTLVDENGRYYNDVFVRDIWVNDATSQKIEVLIDEEGRYYSEFSLPDIWDSDETKPFISGSKEYLNYPTQKSKGLLKRIIEQMTEPGDLVFDCFMGSGTTQAVAMKLGRRFLGADINLGAIQTTTKRLLKVAEELNQNTRQADLDKEQPTYYTGFEVYNVNHYDVFRNPIQAKDLLIQALDIQPISNSIYDGEKDGRMVKLMPVNHIATKEDVADLINGVDYKTFEKRKADNPNQPVEKMQIVCMGHEPDLKAYIQQSIGYKLDIEIVDILRDRADLELKREAEAKISVENNQLTIKQFYPMNLMQKLSLMEENVSDWREMVESVMIDWNYDGAVFQPNLIDVPDKNELVSGSYEIPEDAGNIRVKITDLLSESLEQTINVEGGNHG